MTSADSQPVEPVIPENVPDDGLESGTPAGAQLEDKRPFWDAAGERWDWRPGCAHYHGESHEDCDGKLNTGLLHPGAIPPERGPITYHPPEVYERMRQQVAEVTTEVLQERPELRGGF